MGKLSEIKLEGDNNNNLQTQQMLTFRCQRHKCCHANRKKQLTPGICLIAGLVAVIGLKLVPQVAECSPQTSPLAWMSQVAANPGQKPKLNTAPQVQLDTGNKYYKIMIEAMVHNFKRAINKAGDQIKSGSTSNLTLNQAPISVISEAADKQLQRVTIQELKIVGLSSPKVTNVYVNKNNMKLHVVFNFKSVKVSGKCVLSGKQQTSVPLASNKVLLDATNWNASWSANILPMIRRDHFDMNRVYTTHSQQRLSLNLKECPQALHEQLKVALIDRVKTNIDSRLVDIMESIMMRTDSLSDDATTMSPIDAARKQSSRGKRASVSRNTEPLETFREDDDDDDDGAEDGFSVTNFKRTNWAPRAEDRGGARGGEQKKRVLKRTKRQTPCQEGEDLDEYVDQLFKFGTRLIRAMEPVPTPNTTIELPDYNLKIFLYDGKATRAYKFRRAKPAWVFCSNETISLGVTVVMEDLRVAYKYRVISGNRLLFDGDLEAKLSPKAQAQFSQAIQEEDSEEPVQQRIDRLRVFRLGRVQVVIRGLGNLTQSLSMIINGYLNDNQEELQPTFRMVEGDAVKMANTALSRVNVPLLSVV